MPVPPRRPIKPASNPSHRRRPFRRNAILARHAAARRLLAPTQFRGSVGLNRNVSPYMGGIAGLQAALALLAAIVMVRHSVWPQLVGFAALGALAALFGRFSPLARRHGIVWTCAALLTSAVFITSLASLLGASAEMVVLVVAFIAAASTVIFAWRKLDGPGAVIIVFAAGAAMTPVDSCACRSWLACRRRYSLQGRGRTCWLRAFASA